MVAPAVALCGGGAIAGVGGFLYAGEVNKVEYKMLIKEFMILKSQLLQLKTELSVKQLHIDVKRKKLKVK